MLTFLTELALFINYKCCIRASVLLEKSSCSFYFYLKVYLFDIAISKFKSLIQKVHRLKVLNCSYSKSGQGRLAEHVVYCNLLA